MALSRPRQILAVPFLIEGNVVRNEILLDLPVEERDLVFPEATFIHLRTPDVLQESEEEIKYAYFVDSGMISVLTVMQDGKSVEVGLTGKESCTGLPILVGFKTSDTRFVVQIQGSAFRMSGESLARLLPQCPTLTRRMGQTAQFMGMQASQVAACNRLHEVDKRLARWLLMSQDRVGGDVINLTHEFLSHMLGTRRSSVTVAAGILSKAGVITYNRGHVTIKSRRRLEDSACECYELIQKHTGLWRLESA